MIHSQYLRHCFDAKQYRHVLDVLEASIKAARTISKFDAIAFRGSSGAALAFPLLALTDIPIIHSRKPGSHCSSVIEGFLGASRYAIVDDMVETGGTLKAIHESVAKGYLERNLSVPVLTDIFLVKMAYWTEAFEEAWPGVTAHCLREECGI